MQLADAEAVAKRVRSLMESAASQWKDIRASTTAQCAQLERVSNDLQDRFAWRVILWAVFWFSLAITLGALFGHYCWKH